MFVTKTAFLNKFNRQRDSSHPLPERGVKTLKNKGKPIYMAVTADRYELPLCVGSKEDIAFYTHRTPQQVMEYVARANRGVMDGSRNGWIIRRIYENVRY